ncbi:MAG: hypothetical protein JWL83_292 [Actinomycetia bacterium]|nr:hypothetical protein [Actinomycetes bacterium]
MWTKALGALAACMLAGCASDGGRVTAPPAIGTAATPVTRAPIRATSVTIAPSPRTTIAPAHVVPATWAGDQTPAPRLHNTGANYVGIFRSLDAYRTWLEAHHPDPSLVARVWVVPSEVGTKYHRELTWLRNGRLRWVNVGHSVSVDVASVVGDIVSLRVDEHLPAIEVLNERGQVAGRRAVGPDFQWTVLLSRDGTGRWTIADVGARLGNNIEVHL